MPDNVELNPGTGGATLATDDVGGVHYQVVKLTIGADGAAGSYLVGGSGNVDGGTQRVVLANDVALPAGSNTIGKVDVTSVITGTGATNLGKAIDNAAGGTDTGVAPLAVRTDSLTTLTPADGDYAPIRVSSTGALWVIPSGTVTVSGSVTANAGTNLNTSALALEAGNLATLAGIVTATRAAVNPIVAQTGVQGGSGAVSANTQRVVLATDVALPTGSNVIGQVTQSGSWNVGTVTSLTQMNGQAISMNTGLRDAGTQRVTIATNDIVPVSQSGSWSVSVTGTATVDTELPAAAALADNTANPTVPGVGAFLMAWDGSNWDRVQTGAATGGALKVDGSAVTQPVSGTITANAGSGTFATNLSQVGGTNVVTGGVNGSQGVGGLAAHDAAVSGNPVLIGGRANLDEPAAVDANGDAVHAWFDRLGRQVVVRGHSNPEPPVSINATASGNTTVISAPGSSVSLVIRKASVHNRAATTRTVALTDGAGGTTRWKALLAADGGGSIIDFGDRGWKLTANTLLNVNLDAAGNIDVNVTEYSIE